MPTQLHPIPDIPGVLLEDEDTRRFLNQHVGQLCGLSGGRFPGSQPVSFSSSSIALLEKMNFWVCEKSDGVRILLFVVMNGVSGNQEVWLIDRKQRYFLIEDLHFTHWENPNDPLTDTVLDGELVIDIDSRTGSHTLRFYAFDCLVLGGENIMKKPLVKRYARLQQWVVTPFEKALQLFPDWKENLPFEIVAKQQELSYHITQVLKVHVPQLQHGHDGLIFTCAESEYLPGTDPKILKWKPPSENSIDFRIELRFPPLPTDSTEPDYYAKPAFLLNVWTGGEGYEHFDEMEVDDDEWEKMKDSHEQYDDRVVEVNWDVDRGAWRMLRFRDDKPHGNHKSIVDQILKSIEDGVEIADVIAHTDDIRTAWKAREAARSGDRAPAAQPQAVRRPTGSTYPVTPGGRASTGNGTGAGGYPITPGGPGLMAGLKR